MKAVEFLWIPWERARNFAGRAWLFEVVANWVNSPARSMVIVGSPGSGKSAIAVQAARSSLGQADALYERLHKGWLAATHFCDYYRSETLDPSLFVQSVIRQFSVSIPGFADAARSAALNLTGTPVNVTAIVTAGTIHPGATVVGAEVGLRGYTAGEMASRILGEALRLLDLPIRPVVLVDGIDEAAAFPTDMTMMDLLTGPAFQDLPIRLLVTSRPADFMRPPGTWVVDLDAEVAHGYADVREYVRQCLVPTVPRHRLDLLSDSLLSASGGNFLYAYHVAGALLARDPAGAAPHIWAASLLPTGLAELYDGFRRRTIAATGSEDGKRHWRTVLRPVLALLAVAQGDGLTRYQLQVISGLNGDAVSDALEDLSEFLQFGDATAPIRVFHNSFREYLITGPEVGPPIVDADAAHAKIATAALRQAREHAGVPGIGWEHADGYYRRYLPAHARRAGMLPDLLADVGFVAFMEPYGLLSAIESLDELPAEALAYRQVLPELLGDDVGLRLSYLDIAYHIYALEGQIRRLAEFPVRRPWACRWTRTRPSMHRRSLVGHEHEVTAVAGAQVAGKFVVVSGDSAGYIKVWDAASGALLRRRRGHDAAIVGLAVVGLGQGPVLVSGAKDCTLRKWDFETLEPLGVFSAELDPPNGNPRKSLLTSDGGRRNVLMSNGMSNQAEGPVVHLFEMSAVCCVSVAGLRLVVTAGEDATVRGWDAESTTAIFESGGFRQGVEALDATAFRDTVFIAAASYLDVAVWELSTRKSHVFPRDFRFNVRTLAFTRIGEDLALLTPGRGTGASLWNVRTGELVRELPAPSRVTLLAGTADSSRPCLIAALPGGRIRVWGQEPDTWQDLYGHNSAICSIAVTEVDGGPVILSGGADRSVRVWDPPWHLEPTQAVVTHVWTLRTADVEGRAAVVASSVTGSVSVYDMASGEELHRFRGHAKEVYKSCLATGKQGPVLVSAGDDGLVRVWDARSGGLIHRFNGRRCLDRPLDLAHLGGSVIAFFVSRNGMVGADINSGAIVYEFEVPTSRFTTVAAVSTSTDTFVVALDRETLVAWSGSDLSLVHVDACTLPASKLTATSYGDQIVVVLGYPDGHVETWNQATGEHTVLTGHAAEMTSMSAAFAGPDLVVATSAGTRDVRISASGVLHEIRMTGDVRDIAVHPSGVVAVGTTDGVTCIDPTTPVQDADPVSVARNGTGTAIVELQSASPVGDEQVFDPRQTDLIVGITEDSPLLGMTGSPAVLMQHRLGEAIEQHGPKHPAVARALTRLARQFAGEGKTAQALSALTDVLSMADEIAMPKVDLAEVLELTASLNRRDGNLDAALRALRRLAAIYGEDSAHAALLGETLTRVVQVLIEADRPGEARTTVPSALAVLAKAYGAEHQALSKSLHRVASACAQHGDVQGAIGYLQQALAIDDRRSPSGDRQTRETLLDLAWLTQLTGNGHTGDDHETLVLLNRALAVSQHACGAKSEEVVDVLGLLAIYLARTGSQDQAIAFLEQSIAIESEGQLAATGATTSRLSQLAGLLLDRGPANQAANMAQRLVVASEAVHGPESAETVLALNQYGVALLLIGDLEGARASLERAMRLLQQSQDASEEMRRAIEHNLAAVIQQAEEAPGRPDQ
jgi:WD40 repeat protein/tetratricopeptide (TPR) repeat protein